MTFKLHRYQVPGTVTVRGTGTNQLEDEMCLLVKDEMTT